MSLVTQYSAAAVQSPKWVGNGWYRMLLPGGRPGGSKIPEETTPLFSCGTYVGENDLNVINICPIIDMKFFMIN
jgi:hypothetical protein